MQTDIDMLLSRELIEQTRDLTADGIHVFKKSHEEDGRYRPCTYGSWNGLTARDWLKTGGLDERMFGYGFEDTHFFIRNRENGFRILESREFEPVHRRHRTDRLWLRVDREQYARNRRLGDIPRQVNYLEARINNDYPAGHLDRVSFYTNSACPRHCPECSRQEVRKDFAGYEATMDEVRFFLDCTRFQGITYDWLILAGGETLLWPNLIDAMKLFKESPFFKKIMVFTAAVSERLYRELEPLADQVVFSFYGETPDYIPPNMVISDITKNHWRIRTENKPEFLPADCWCRGVYVMKGRVYSCSQYCEYALRAGADLKDEHYSEPLTSNYQDICLGKDIYRGRFCSTCISNAKAHNWLGTVDNTKQKVYAIQ